jgi:FkbM family methyltransferase
MNVKMLKFFRSIQVHFPYLQDYKFLFQQNLRKVLNRTHEEDFEILPSLPVRSNLFIDVGANRGDAIQSILMRAPGANVVAFEPNSYLCGKLVKRYGKDSRINIVNYGLGNADSSFDLFVPFYNNYMFDGLASFKEENARDWLINRLYNFRREKFELKKLCCQVRRLDDFNLNPGFIKVDVQGFEYEVLQGAVKTLKTHKPMLLIETPGENEVNLLRDLDYHPFALKGGTFTSGTKHSNVFFFPTELLDEVGKKTPLRMERQVAA